MPSPRRLKATGLLLFLTVLVLLYIRHGAQSTQTSPFYTRTVEAMKNREASEAVAAEEAARMERVRRVGREHEEAVAGDKTVKSSGDSGEKSVAGRKMMKTGGSGADDGKVVHNAAAEGDDGVAKVGNIAPKASKAVKNSEHADDETEETEQEHLVEEEMNAILKKGPIIIFSKSFCPFSKKAKSILLNAYAITPPPHVVELDQHPLGPLLQAALQKSTGRRTVPNVLINGKSIGGGDEVAALHSSGQLADKVRDMGGKRIMSVEAKAQDDEEGEGSGRSEQGHARVQVRFRS
ncbi:hypothetical protein MBLNU230_g3750t1 [Neophaeotheca triangularis]